MRVRAERKQEQIGRAKGDCVTVPCVWPGHKPLFFVSFVASWLSFALLMKGRKKDSHEVTKEMQHEEEQMRVRAERKQEQIGRAKGDWATAPCVWPEHKTLFFVTFVASWLSFALAF